MSHGIVIKPGQKPNEESSKLEGQIAFILMKAGVIGPELDNCMFWAFGPDAWYVPPCDWPARWNKMHPKAFRAGKKDKFVEFIFVVGDMYAKMRDHYYKEELKRIEEDKKREESKEDEHTSGDIQA